MKSHTQMDAEILGSDSSALLNLARIVAIVDTFNTLTMTRPYKHAWLVADAINLLKKEAGAYYYDHEHPFL